jgi:signal transduction histidine kinase
MFDARQLRRWEISEDSVPAGSIIRFRDLTIWGLYRWQIIGFISFCLVEAFLIVALLVQGARRGRAEAELRESHNRVQNLAGRLIIAQEEERKHITRELHDSLSQQVAALAIGLTRLERHLPDTNGARAELMSLDNRLNELSEHVRSMSHRLHSSTLEHVGLADALKLHCSELSEQKGIAVDFDICGNIESLPSDTALCLYRVAQESLRNVVKHSRAERANVTILRDGDTIELRVADRGVGFDPSGKREGLGLVSMEERVRLLGGSLKVISQPGDGTELRVWVPAESRS